MVSTTSGTTSFSMDVDDIIEAAFEPLGGEYQSGVDTAKARRALNLILIELQNKNIPLNKLAFLPSLTLTAGTAAYQLDEDIVDVPKISISVSGQPNTQIPLRRESLKQYQDMPNKSQTGRPTIFIVERTILGPKVTFWPVPDATQTYEASMFGSTKIEDVDASYQKIDLSYRYLPMLIKWLSYELSINRPGIPEEIKANVEKRWRETSMDSFEEDRERVDWTVKPGGIRGR